jgi:hypothetical protein
MDAQAQRTIVIAGPILFHHIARCKYYVMHSQAHKELAFRFRHCFQEGPNGALELALISSDHNILPISLIRQLYCRKGHEK